MAKGSCACGAYTYEVPNPEAIVVCHCVPCQKFAGANGSTNGISPTDQYKLLSGEARSWTRKGDSGQDVTNFYCAECNNLMRVEIEAMPGVVVFKPGTLEDQSLLSGIPVAQEIYTRGRPNCFDALKGAEQKTAS